MKSNETKKRKSGFNPNRTCYLTADGKYYCYERWDDDAKCVVTQRFEVGKDLSVELTIMLDESDHDMDLQSEAGQTGKLPSSAAMTNRKNKIINKVAKSFGVERVKRHKYPKKD